MPREFDLVFHGPTGYTGKLCAQHIVKHFPTNIKWALAGRSLPKVEQIARELKELNPDRDEPGKFYLRLGCGSCRLTLLSAAVLAVQLNGPELQALAQRTRLIINAVGPYHLYSTPVVEACASSGTHYVDV